MTRDMFPDFTFIIYSFHIDVRVNYQHTTIFRKRLIPDLPRICFSYLFATCLCDLSPVITCVFLHNQTRHIFQIQHAFRGPVGPVVGRPKVFGKRLPGLGRHSTSPSRWIDHVRWREWRLYQHDEAGVLTLLLTVLFVARKSMDTYDIDDWVA